MSHFSQNSHFQNIIFHKIHIFETSYYVDFLDKKLGFARVCLACRILFTPCTRMDHPVNNITWSYFSCSRTREQKISVIWRQGESLNAQKFSSLPTL